MDDRNRTKVQLTAELEELRKRNEALEKAEDRRKQVEESLREKTQFIESLINLCPDILYIYDIVEQKNVFSNDGIKKILGYSVKEIQKMGNQVVSLLMHPDDFKKYRAEIYPRYQKVKDNEIINHQYRMKHKNGTWIWLDSTETIYMRQADGSPKQIFGVIHDITYQKKAEEDINNSENRLRNLINTIKTAIVIHAHDTSIIQCNQTAQEILGLSKDEMLGKKANDPVWKFVKENGSVLPLDEYPVNIVLKDKKILEDYIVGVQNPVRDTITWVLINAVPEYDNNNTITQVLITFMDITKRKQTEEALLESEELFRRLSESSPMGIFRTDKDGRVLYLNDRWCSITGMNRQDALGYGWSSALHPEDKPRVIEEWTECLNENKGYRGEFRFVRPNGDIKWVYTRTSPIKSAEGDIIGHVGANEDFTERKKAEEEIIRLAKFPSESPNPVMRISHDGTILYDNIPSTPLLTLWSTDNNRIFTDEISEIIQKALKTEISQVTEIECNNTIYSLTFTPFAKSGYVNVYGLDITKLKKAEKELRQYEHIVSSSTDMLALLDKQFCFIAVNTTYLKAFNVTYNELIGHTVSEVFGEEFFKEIIKPNAERCLTGEEINYQAWFDFPVHGKRYMDITYYPYFGSDNKVVSFVVNGRDITDRKKAEEKHKKLEVKILHSQKLESLGVLAGGIAHDFNNLLVAILGNAELALMDMSPESPVYESVEEIKNASVRASELTRQMLAYSGKGQFVVKAIDINRLIDEMGHILNVSISKKAVLKYNFDKNLPSVYADASQIRQIIMNLIINASEAIGEKSGIITISTGLIDAKRDYLSIIRIDEFLPEGYYVFIEVSDTGCGMDKEVQDKLFDPFFSTKFIGRGLGLSAVQGIVRGHTGAIKVYSEPGKGSTFKILLPCPDLLYNVPEKEISPELRELTAKGTVLVVDDEETVRAYASRILERLGFKVLTAKDGRDGVEKFRAHTDEISLVLLDMTMPHMDGKEAFRELKIIKPDISVILSSGYNEQEATSYFTGKGLAGFIQKPFQIDTLVAKLREVLQ